MSTAHSTLCTTAGSSAGPRPASARALTSAMAGVRPRSTALSTVARPRSTSPFSTPAICFMRSKKEPHHPLVASAC